MMKLFSEEALLRRLHKSLISQYEPVFSLDESAWVDVVGKQTPVLKNGGRTVNLAHEILDDFRSRTGYGGSIFVRNGDSFVRVTTSILPNGKRLLGVDLEPTNPANRALSSGRHYFGYTSLSDMKLAILYMPLVDAHGSVVGAIGVGMSTKKGPRLALQISFAVTAWLGMLTGGTATAFAMWAPVSMRPPAFPSAVLGLTMLTLTGAWVYWLVESKVSVSLRRAQTAAQRLAKGDLTEQEPLSRNDEVGEILEALNGITVGLSSLVRNVARVVQDVNRGSNEIAGGNAHLSERTERQAASLEETAASMAQLTQAVNQNTDNAREANSSAVYAAQMADAGNEAVQGLVQAIKDIGSGSAKIGEITGLIEGIAFQTNILALNAAVEAARAGEHGRGFAVVASEVRSLAQRSATAAKDISELIASSVAVIERSVDDSAHVATTILELKNAIARVSDFVGGIATASEEQSRGIEQINQAVTQMDEVTQHNAALVEEAASAAQSLSSQAVSLKEAVSMFKLLNV
ncbi:MAG TPA: methyl-accepting chemotaxis protein [Paraburkholderia sp.]